jgi:hypothetical protein
LTTRDAILQSFILHGFISFCFYAVYQREKILRGNFLKQKLIASYSNAFQAELEKRGKIQKDFLPRDIPNVPNCDIATYFHPALQLSGDFYDVFTDCHPPGRSQYASNYHRRAVVGLMVLDTAWH